MRNEYKYCVVVITLLFVMTACSINPAESTPSIGQNYYIDSGSGDDNNLGTSKTTPWKTLDKVSGMTFQPGDTILFKRGSSYEGSVTIQGDGTASHPITIAAYGSGNAPSFSNPRNSINNGNAMRIRGDYHIVENLYFHHCAPAVGGAVSFEQIWAVGALHVGLGNDHVIIRNNEFANNPKAIQSYSQYSLITKNYIHDINDSQAAGWLSEPYWGPIGIQLGIGNQEISFNTIENMFASGGEWGGDGGAIEIDDGRNHKDNIHIHHNTTYHNMGFLEISYWHDIAMMSSSNISIDHNVSRDYQDFVFWWAPTTNSVIQNNTIIRTDNQYTGPFDGVFFIDAPPAEIAISKNIVVTDNDLTEAIFIEGFDGGVKDVVHTFNCYWNVIDENVNLGLPFGVGEIVADPLFVDFEGGDYHLQPDSPASGWGAFND